MHESSVLIYLDIERIIFQFCKYLIKYQISPLNESIGTYVRRHCVSGSQFKVFLCTVIKYLKVIFVVFVELSDLISLDVFKVAQSLL